MANKKQGAAKTTATSKKVKVSAKTGTKTPIKPKASTKELEETNKTVTTQQVIVRRELKYIYPKGCIDTLKRKSYRGRVRDKIQRLEAKVATLKGEDRRIQKEVLAAYRKEHLVKG